MLGGVIRGGLSNRKILSQMERDIQALDLRCYEEVVDAVNMKKVAEIPDAFKMPLPS